MRKCHWLPLAALACGATVVLAGGGGSEENYDCAGLLRAQLVAERECHVRATVGEVHCYQRTDTLFMMKKLTFQQEVRELSNSTFVTICLGLVDQTWDGLPNFLLHMFFQSNLTFAVIQTDRDCAYGAGKCEWLSLHVRADLAALPLFSLLPEDTAFWNLSSPLFAPPSGWLLKLSMRGSGDGAATPETAVRALAGSGVRAVRLRGRTDGTRVGPRRMPVFTNMSALRVLELVDGVIFRGVCFRNTSNIEVLRLSRDFVKKLPSCVRNLKHLSVLSLADNELDGLDKVFSERLDISEITLNDNDIRTIPPVLPLMPKVLRLFLEKCGIQTVPAHALRNFVNLMTLSLRQNVLVNIDPLAFASLPKLTSLWLASTALREWPLRALQHLSLFHFSISRNYLTSLPRLKNTSIVLLDVSYNQIEGWGEDSLFRCDGSASSASQQLNANCLNGTWVEQLNLQGNMIRALTQAMLQSLDALHKVDLTANKMNCADCGIPQVQEWLKSTAVQVVEPFTCNEPLNQKDKLVIEIQYDPNTCLGPYRNQFAVAVPLGVVAAIDLMVAVVVYLYRTEVAYLQHLIRVRHATNHRPRESRESQESRENVYDAFVCYSGKDRKWVLRELAPLLERGAERFRLCLFDRDFALGSHIVSNIVDAIDRSAKVVVVLTPHFIESKWCAWELEMANHKLFGEDRSFLVLLELEPLRREGLPRLLRFLMDTRPLVRWPGTVAGAGAAEVEAAVEQLRRALGPSLSSRPTPNAAPGDEGDCYAPPDEASRLLR